MAHYISRHALEMVNEYGYYRALEWGHIRLLVADEDGYDAVLTDHEIAELSAGLENEDDPTAIWQPDMLAWDPPAGYRSPPQGWNS